jgi:hypothetical protein
VGLKHISTAVHKQQAEVLSTARAVYKFQQAVSAWATFESRLDEAFSCLDDLPNQHCFGTNNSSLNKGAFYNFAIFGFVNLASGGGRPSTNLTPSVDGKSEWQFL